MSTVGEFMKMRPPTGAVAPSRSTKFCHRGTESIVVLGTTEGARADQQLLPKLQTVFKDSRRTYRSPPITAALLRGGERCGKNRIARLMREHQLKARQKRRFVPRTTQSNRALPIAPNSLAKVPAPARPDQLWVGGITYIGTAECWIYLAVVLNACSRRGVGWAMGALPWKLPW